MNHAIDIASQILSLIDLTSLNATDTENDIRQLCQAANSKHGKVAALCIYPQFIRLAKDELARMGCSDIKVATVVNFPAGTNSPEQVSDETRFALEQGADEIDLVIPYADLKKGLEAPVLDTVRACRCSIDSFCPDQTGPTKLKVIIESGELQTPELIRKAAQLVITAGADMVKTSTGKVEVNATLEAASCILTTIAEANNQTLGFKAAGGIRTLEEAKKYVSLASRIMGERWVTSDHFRFGASGLLTDVLAHLDGVQVTETHGY